MLLWNREDEERAPWLSRLRALQHSLLAPGQPDFGSDDWRKVWNEPAASQLFRVEPEVVDKTMTRVRFVMTMIQGFLNSLLLQVSRQQMWDRIQSKSSVGALDAGALKEFRAACDRVLDEAFAGVSEEDTVECPQNTLTFAAIKRE